MPKEFGINNYYKGRTYYNDLFSKCINAGFKSIMLWWGEYDPEISKYKVAEEAIGKGLKIENLHAPFKIANILWEDSDNKLNIAYDIYKKCIIDAGRLNVPYLVIHPTRTHHVPLKKNIAIYRIKRLLDIAEKNNVILALENLMHIDYLDYILQNISHPNLRVCYDSGHAFCFNESCDLIKKYSKLIVTIHLHDNDGFSDLHQIIGDGSIQWINIKNTLDEINYKGNINFECSMKHYDTNLNEDDFLTIIMKRAQKIWQ